MNAGLVRHLPDPASPLDRAAATDAFDRILSGDVDDDAIAAFLIALSERGETAEELAAAAQAMRSAMLKVEAPEGAIDVCGTGGDMAGTVNISTAVGFVAAAGGVPVARHGNRAASSRSGVADVLSALGWNGALPLHRIEAAFNEVGIAFLHAQHHHPAMARVGPVRRRIGRRTIFNLLGPLANPASVRRQMIGVFAPQWQEPMAEAARSLGSTHMVVAHGAGLDEITVHDDSRLVFLKDGAISATVVAPEALGVGRHPLERLKGGSPEENAAMLRALFDGRTDTPALAAYRDVVAANAAAAFLVAGKVADLRAGAARASQLIADGAAKDMLARFIAFQ